MGLLKLQGQRVNYDVETFVGRPGTIFYGPDDGIFRLSDGQTPGGIALSIGGGDGGSYILPTASTTTKGGVKIDGTTINISNQVISVVNGVFTTGSYSDPSWITSLAYSKLTGTPTIPTNNNQLTNGAGYITSSALTPYALTSAIPTNNNQLTNGAGYITSSALSGYATELFVTSQGYITTAALAGYALTTDIPTDVNQLTDADGLLGGGSYTLPIATNTVLGGIKIGSGLSINDSGVVSVPGATFDGAFSSLTGIPTTIAGYGITDAFSGSYTDLTDKPTIPTDVSELTDTTNLLVHFSGSYTDLTNKPTLFSGSYTDLTEKPTIPADTNDLTNGAGYITSSALTGYATETFVTTQGYITSAALTGYATELYVTGQGYLTAVSWDDVSGKPTFATVATSGSYTDLSNTPTIPTDVSELTDTTNLLVHFSGSYTDLTNKPTIPTDTNDLTNGAGYITSAALTGYATETFVTTQGYITSAALTGYATETYVNQAITDLVNGAPEFLDTLKELADQLTSDGLSIASLISDINNKANINDLVLTVAGDDSTERTINLGEGIKFSGTNISITTDAEGNINFAGFSGSYNDLTDKPTFSPINANGTFSMPILSAEPADLQAGQMALANGTTWDPIGKNEGLPYVALYTGSVWIDIGGLTRTDVYAQVLELGL